MRVVDEEALSERRRCGKCELCGRRVFPLDCHHIFSKGAGRVDVRCNLIAVDRICHSKIHDGSISRETVLGVVAKREGMTPEAIEETVYKIRRSTKTAGPNRRGHNLKGPNKPVMRGDSHPFWKGDAARDTTKRKRAQKQYQLSQCERCTSKATDRHHKDGDTGNNVRSNIEFLCRRCHMKADGRFKAFIEQAKKNAVAQRTPKRPCCNCERLSKPLWRGRCHACDMFFRRNGRDR